MSDTNGGGGGTAVAERPTSAALAAAPILDSLHERKLTLIGKTVAKNCSREEIGMFLELAAKYDLDPFAHEVWCAKGQRQDGGEGRLLLMVGRDGLRKIAQRNGLTVNSDVVRAEDEYEVAWIDSQHDAREGEWEANGCAPFHRVVHRRKGLGTRRGEIVGSWCRVRDAAGCERGWFEAPIEEYKPTNPNKLKFSPWGSQESAMMQAASERQGLRQATPLSGLLVEGEMDRNDERGLGIAAEDPDAQDVVERAVREVVSEEWAVKLIPLLLRVNELQPNTWLPSAIQMQFGGQSDETLEGWLVELQGTITTLEANAPQAEADDEEGERVTDAEVVEPDAQANAGEEEGPSEEAIERVGVLRSREADLIADFERAEPGSEEADVLGAELDEVQGEIRELGFAVAGDDA